MVSVISTCAGVNKGGVQRFNGHLYWFSWQDNDGSVANAKWDWFNARNYCRSLSRYIHAVSIISTISTISTGSGAWTSSASRPGRSTTGSRDSSTVRQTSTFYLPTSINSMFAVNVPYFWTSGRLCDFDGCDRPDFFPKNINGWFWSANQARLAPTDSKSAFHDWSATGG